MTDSPTITKGNTTHSLKDFWALFIVQAQGAFSDNLFKFLVIFTSINVHGINVEDRDYRLFLIGIVFSLPFILFSMTSGCLVDRTSKAKVITWTKRAEIFIMVFGSFAHWLLVGNRRAPLQPCQSCVSLTGSTRRVAPT